MLLTFGVQAEKRNVQTLGAGKDDKGKGRAVDSDSGSSSGPSSSVVGTLTRSSQIISDPNAFDTKSESSESSESSNSAPSRPASFGITIDDGSGPKLTPPTTPPHEKDGYISDGSTTADHGHVPPSSGPSSSSPAGNVKTGASGSSGSGTSETPDAAKPGSSKGKEPQGSKAQSTSKGNKPKKDDDPSSRGGGAAASGSGTSRKK
ncbi:hypothetical protein CC1G_06079 [Coprinopsis cinerea okayama7|uniref:Uncharacterized protein n=1 Tax=Coprinopsis cinerea (strain Okayama-7 / 130 / ATCC MYA-4618 / FGSC 9003) TaxID=240176 RepID=A8PA28_COPC7|nr:hypothetical protein CC1G_06079 [Coprinopsis cinerea okayama7\|eukprot:XP_001839889.2 hypothetical protein CC1G_06079 [Coprinopsis cinerea okayama7\